MTDYTPPDVHRVRTRTTSTQERTVRLGYVDRHGAYRFPDGRTVEPDGGLRQPDGEVIGGNALIVVQADGDLRYGPGLQDAADPAGTAAARLHTVDAEYQGLYDADPDAFDVDPSTVFAAVDGA